ncbi:MAG TPA: hypothetical protein VGL94_21250 [Ktedonobacteraceae bacterium]
MDVHSDSLHEIHAENRPRSLRDIQPTERPSLPVPRGDRTDTASGFQADIGDNTPSTIFCNIFMAYLQQCFPSSSCFLCRERTPVDPGRAIVGPQVAPAAQPGDGEGGPSVNPPDQTRSPVEAPNRPDHPRESDDPREDDQAALRANFEELSSRYNTYGHEAMRIAEQFVWLDWVYRRRGRIDRVVDAARTLTIGRLNTFHDTHRSYGQMLNDYNQRLTEFEDDYEESAGMPRLPDHIDIMNRAYSSMYYRVFPEVPPSRDSGYRYFSLGPPLEEGGGTTISREINNPSDQYAP